MADATATLTKKDLKSDQDVRWCPGCGDYAILNAIQVLLAEQNIKRENTVFVSGIGCSSRFPYYMSTYGFHTIHGRGAPVATGIKAANPDLDVWLVTGDGDGLSIGGNHTAHLLRRNVDINVLLFNNEVYGLTKGQYSPTSPLGTRAKSSPMGSIDRPFNPISFALGCNATFVARTMDVDMKHMVRTFRAASEHRGTSFVEIMQNCVIFNKDFYNATLDKSVRQDRIVDLLPGEKMVYGKESDKGIKADGWEIKAVSSGDADAWNPSTESSAPAFLMSMMDANPELPTPFGIFRSVDAPVYEREVTRQIEEAIEKKGRGKLRDLVWAGETWEVS